MITCMIKSALKVTLNDSIYQLIPNTYQLMGRSNEYSINCLISCSIDQGFDYKCPSLPVTALTAVLVRVMKFHYSSRVMG